MLTSKFTVQGMISAVGRPLGFSTARRFVLIDVAPTDCLDDSFLPSKRWK